jgi:hypothetical protein
VIADLESALLAQVELHKFEVLKLEEKLDEMSENFEVEKEKREIVETKRNRVQRNIDELRNSKEQCYSITAHCCEKLKGMFTNIGAFSSDRNFVRGDAEGAIKWIESEIEDFDKVLTGRGDFCACVGARGAVSLLEKVDCDHAKVVIQLDFVVSTNDVK